MFSFLLGFIVGVSFILFILYVIFFDPWSPRAPPHRFIDQFPPVQIPPELKRFLRTGEDGQGVSRWESCSSLSLLLHMLYQEHKDSRGLRRWLYKRLQVELNDVITRTPMGRFVQDIRILDLSLGTKFPVINNIRVERVEMSEDRENFEKIHFVLDMEYTGNFETSIGIWFLGKEGHLSLKVTRLAGMVRLCLSRKPYNHWSFCFLAEPLFDFDVTSQLNGHSLRRLIPVITQSIRHTMRRKFVSPNYKIRYRPLFPHPLLQPSPPPGSFNHIRLEGGLEVTVLQCTRLKTSLVSSTSNDNQYEVYATVALAHRPFLQSTSSIATHSFTCMIQYSRFDPSASIGLTFDKNAFIHGARAVRVLDVVEGSLADKANFKPGDVLIAINNVPVRHERQVIRLMGTLGDLVILVERVLEDPHDDIGDDEVIIRNRDEEGTDNEFACLGEQRGGREEEPVLLIGRNTVDGEGISINRRSTPERSSSPLSDSLHRRHSLSQLPSSFTEETETSSLLVDSLCSSLHDIINLPSTSKTTSHVQRTESARVPHVLVSVPSMEIRRTRSESELHSASTDSKQEEEVEEVFDKRVDHGTERSAVDIIMRDDNMDRELINNRRGGDSYNERPIDTDQTLIPGKGIELRGSSTSMSSSTYRVEDDSGIQSEESLLFSRNRNGSKRQRFRDTLNAGKKKVFDLIPASSKRRPNMSVIVDDVGVDALIDELLQPNDGGTTDTSRHSPSPSINGSKRTPPGTEKSKRSKNKIDSNVSNEQSSSPPSPSRISSILSTRPVHLSEDVIWGQSLHFNINNNQSQSSFNTTSTKPPKFLNVTIHAREIRTKEGEEPSKPILLGYCSLYIPQLIDDCQLTLSNSHREVFHLKPPTIIPMDVGASNSTLYEFSQHHGFDPRLCYGDVTLRFRYFPNGLPKGSGINPSCHQGESEEIGRDDGDKVNRLNGGRNITPPPILPIGHQWKAISCTRNSSTCSLCRGKIWTKAGTCCQKCLVVCHHKCAMKANSAICCTPTARSSVDDEELRRELFGEPSSSKDVIDKEKEELKKVSPNDSETSSLKECSRDETENVSNIVLGEKNSSYNQYRNDTELVSRRSKLRSKMSGVTEKFTHWRRKKNDPSDADDTADMRSSSSNRLSGSSLTDGISLMSSIPIENELSDILPFIEGSPHINQVYFQPGNAYNEETIANAKVLGRTIFSEIEPIKRRIKVNEQIDRIRDAITETKLARMVAMKSSTGSFTTPSNPLASPSSSSSTSSTTPSSSSHLSSLSFESLEDRMQALAVLMLHYCAALQDCNEESEGDVISIRSEEGRGDSSMTSSGRLSSISNEHTLTRSHSPSPTPSTGLETSESIMIEP